MVYFTWVHPSFFSAKTCPTRLSDERLLFCAFHDRLLDVMQTCIPTSQTPPAGSPGSTPLTDLCSADKALLQYSRTQTAWRLYINMKLLREMGLAQAAPLDMESPDVCRCMCCMCCCMSYVPLWQIHMALPTCAVACAHVCVCCMCMCMCMCVSVEGGSPSRFKWGSPSECLEIGDFGHSNNKFLLPLPLIFIFFGIRFPVNNLCSSLKLHAVPTFFFVLCSHRHQHYFSRSIFPILSQQCFISQECDFSGDDLWPSVLSDSINGLCFFFSSPLGYMNRLELPHFKSIFINFVPHMAGVNLNGSNSSR